MLSKKEYEYSKSWFCPTVGSVLLAKETLCKNAHQSLAKHTSVILSKPPYINKRKTNTSKDGEISYAIVGDPG